MLRVLGFRIEEEALNYIYGAKTKSMTISSQFHLRIFSHMQNVAVE